MAITTSDMVKWLRRHHWCNDAWPCISNIRPDVLGSVDSVCTSNIASQSSSTSTSSYFTESSVTNTTDYEKDYTCAPLKCCKPGSIFLAPQTVQCIPKADLRLWYSNVGSGKSGALPAMKISFIPSTGAMIAAASGMECAIWLSRACNWGPPGNIEGNTFAHHNVLTLSSSFASLHLACIVFLAQHVCLTEHHEDNLPSHRQSRKDLWHPMGSLLHHPAPTSSNSLPSTSHDPHSHSLYHQHPLSPLPPLGSPIPLDEAATAETDRPHHRLHSYRADVSALQRLVLQC